ncbi:hypothetical protein [Lysinibacillus xylanilyticus]|uniref:hypothetical protein n=1 Tax=Lysinibacillus xylanilyticus TaxID=582475 RepID=UPI003CFD5B4A
MENRLTDIQEIITDALNTINEALSSINLSEVQSNYFLMTDLQSKIDKLLIEINKIKNF